MPIHLVWKSGNSLVVTIPHKLATELRLSAGSAVNFRKTSSGCLSVKPLWIRNGADLNYRQEPTKRPRNWTR